MADNTLMQFLDNMMNISDNINNANQGTNNINSAASGIDCNSMIAQSLLQQSKPSEPQSTPQSAAPSADIESSAKMGMALGL